MTEKNCLSCFLLPLVYFLCFIFLMSACDIPCQLDDVSLPQLGLQKLLVFFHGSSTKKPISYVLKKHATAFKLNVVLYIP